MLVAVCLLLYSFAVVVIVPGLLVRLTRSGAGPWLAIAAWLTAIVGVLASWLVAAGFLVVALARSLDQPARIASACFAAMRQVAAGGSGPLLQATLFVLTAAGIGAVPLSVSRRSAPTSFRLAAAQLLSTYGYRSSDDIYVIGLTYERVADAGTEDVGPPSWLTCCSAQRCWLHSSAVWLHCWRPAASRSCCPLICRPAFVTAAELSRRHWFSQRVWRR
jgi:hypothetical protein